MPESKTSHVRPVYGESFGDGPYPMPMTPRRLLTLAKTAVGGAFAAATIECTGHGREAHHLH